MMQAWAIWLICSFAPRFAPDWYDLHFDFYQSLAPLLIIFFCLPTIENTPTRRAFGSVLVISILLNIGHLGPLSGEHYDSGMMVINLLEFALLFIVNGIIQLRQKLHERSRDTAGSLRGRSTANP